MNTFWKQKHFPGRELRIISLVTKLLFFCGVKQGRATKLSFAHCRTPEAAPAQHSAALPVFTLQAFYLWVSRTHSYKTQLSVGMREPRVTNIHQDSDRNKSLLFTEVGSVNSKACAEHSHMELCWEARPALHTGRSEAFPPQFPEPSSFHWFEAQRWAENSKTISRIDFLTILINPNENHKA